MCAHVFAEGKVYVQVFLFMHLNIFLSCLSCLFALPEHQVHEAADKSHGEADPGQDVGGAVGAFLKTVHVEALFLSRVDGSCYHHA